MTFDIDTIAAELNDDGDHCVVEAPDGSWTFRLQIRPDDGLSYEDMEDEEVFGKVAWIDGGRAWYGKRSYPEGQRPSEFTGAARKMSSESYQGGEFWYEPPAEFRKFKGSGWDDWDAWERARDAHLRHVRSIVSWGYIYVHIEAEHQLPDGYHRTWDNSIGGIEAEADRAYLDSVFHDVLSELITEIS